VTGNPLPSNARLEKSLEAYLRSHVRRVGGICLKLIPTQNGIPDRLVIFPGGSVHFVELKSENGKVSTLQEVRHGQLRALGVGVSVIWEKAQVRPWLIRALDEASERPARRRRSAQ